VLRREAEAAQLASGRLSSESVPAVQLTPPAATRWYGGVSVAGGLLLGAAVAAMGSRRRASVPAA
jgi:hypothetical protein